MLSKAQRVKGDLSQLEEMKGENSPTNLQEVFGEEVKIKHPGDVIFMDQSFALETEDIEADIHTRDEHSRMDLLKPHATTYQSHAGAPVTSEQSPNRARQSHLPTQVKRKQLTEEPLSKYDLLLPIRKAILRDLEHIEEVHNRVKDLLRANQYTQTNQKGLFFFSETEIEQAFREYYQKIDWLTERTFRMWRDNYRAGKYSEVDLDQHFQLGDPILRSEFQVSLPGRLRCDVDGQL